MSARNSADMQSVRSVTISEFRAKCSALLSGVRKTKRPIQATRWGRPLVKICLPGHSPEERARRNARDLALLNQYADELNADAVDGLEFQAEVDIEEKKVRAGKRKWNRRR